MKKLLLSVLLASGSLLSSGSFAAQPEVNAPVTASAGYGPVIIWPAKFTPGTTDNFVSNKVVVKGLTINDVWPFLTHANEWPSYYKNSANIHFYKQGETELHQGTRFKFTTFGFPVESRVTEYQPSVNGSPARLAWDGWVVGDAQHRLDVHHAWLLENLPGGRLLIQTEESQIGVPAKQLHNTLPNPMLNAHELWLTGLVSAAEKAKK